MHDSHDSIALYRRKNANGQEFGGYIHEFRVPGTHKKLKINTGETDREKATEIARREKDKILRREQGEIIDPTLGEVVLEYLKRGTIKNEDRDRPRHLLSKSIGRKIAKTTDATGKETYRITDEPARSAEGAPLFGLDASTPITEICYSDVEELKAARHEEGYADGTYNREAGVLRRMVNWARWNLKVRPADDLRFEMHQTEGRPRALEDVEIDAMLRELDPMVPYRVGIPPVGRRPDYIQDMIQDNHDLAVFLLDTGCRYGEACYLGPRDVNVDRRTLHLYRPKVKNASDLKMTDRLCEIMERRLRQHPGGVHFVFPGRDPNGQLNGKPRSANGTRGIKNAMDRAGLNTPHIVERYGAASVVTLRHTYATKLLRLGMSDKQVATLLGHKSTAMVNKHYGHLASVEVSENAVALLNGLTLRQAA